MVNSNYMTSFLEELRDFTDGELNLAVDQEIKFYYYVNDKKFLLKGILSHNGLISNLQIRDPYWKALSNYFLEHKEDESGTINLHDYMRDLKDITLFNLLDDLWFEIKTNNLSEDERATIQAAIDGLQGLLDE